MIYLPLSEEGYELCQPVEEQDFETLNSRINGDSCQATWQPLHMKIVTEDEGTELQRSDAPWLGSHALIFRHSALDKIGNLLERSGELLPLISNDEELFVFNPLQVRDALDEDLSSLMRFSNGRIMRVNQYVFRPEVVGDVDFFKIPNLRVSPTFVTQRFVDAWSDARLCGLRFRRV